MTSTLQKIAIARAQFLHILRPDIVDEATNLFHEANYMRPWTAIIADIFADRCATVPDDADSDALLLHLGLLHNKKTDGVFDAAAQPDLPLGISVRDLAIRFVDDYDHYDIVVGGHHVNV